MLTMSMFILFDTSPTTPFSEMVVFIIMILVYPLSVRGMRTYLVCIDLLTPFLHPLVVWWLVSCPCYTFYLVMLCILTPKSATPFVDVMHTYFQVCWTPCCCYACLPWACMPPLTTYFTIFLVVWWSTSWPFCRILLLMLSPCVLILSMYNPLDTSIIISLEVWRLASCHWCILAPT